MTIPLAVPDLGGNESRYLQECIDTNFVSSVGPFVGRFEDDFAAFVGARHAVACSSGTAALHVALLVAGVGPESLVAVSDFTFVASANAVSYTGADILLVDSERETWNMDTERLHDDVVADAARNARIPDAIQVVHVLGHPARMEPLLALRDTYGITIIEDAAEALGATWTAGPLAGDHVGTVGELGCYSFNGNKVMTTGNGGMIVTDDPDLAQRARHLTTQAKAAHDRYEHDEIGYNYRLSNVAAAIGVAQLEQLPAFLARKREIAARYRGAARQSELEPGPSAPWANPSCWLNSVLLPRGVSREKAIEELLASDVQARPLWMPMHRQRPYAEAPCVGGDVSDELFLRGISLPSSTGLTTDQQQLVLEALHSVTDQRRG